MKTRRLVSLLLALLLALSAAALAEGEELTNEAGFVYILDGDGNAEIVSYTGKAEKLEIPAQLDGHPVTVIGERAFFGTNTLTEVTVPEGVTTLRKEAFNLCHSLTRLRLPEGLAVLEDHAIRGCSKLKYVNLPDSVTEAGDGLFDYCSVLEKVNVSADHPYFSVVDGVLFSRPDHRLIWYPMARKNKTYAIPSGTEIVGSSSFAGSALTQVTVPESVTKLGSTAFEGCSKLQKVNIPSKVTELVGVFSRCTALKRVDVSANNPVYESKNGVLFNKKKKELVFYPAGRKEKTYAIPKGTLSIGASAFSDSKLTGVTIPKSVRTIMGNAFLSCDNLKKVTVPEGVERIDSQAFQWCKQLTEISLPRSLIYMPGNPFSNCYSLKTVKIAADHPMLAIKNGALISKPDQRLIWYPKTSKTKKYTVPKGVKIIGLEAFQKCRELNEVILPEGVEEIEMFAFSGCVKLKKVALPASLKSVDPTAFREKVGEQKLIDATFIVPGGSYAENFCKSFRLKTKVE